MDTMEVNAMIPGKEREKESGTGPLAHKYLETPRNRVTRTSNSPTFPSI
jgi:hypothetical protein